MMKHLPSFSESNSQLGAARFRVAKFAVAGAGIAIATALSLATPVSAQQGPDYGGFSRSVLLPFVNGRGDGSIGAPPKLTISFGGASRSVVMDTGSTGIVVSASAIPNVDGLPNLGPARFAYSSSGRVMEGDWVVTPLTITGGDGTSVTTRPIPVIAVRRISCFDNARNCVPEERPEHVSMMGVGFAREGDHQHAGTPDHNPFLNIAEAGGHSMRRGYIISADGVRLGLSREAGRGFSFIKLARNADGTDWSGIPMCVTLPNAPPSCGTALIDTGVTDMYLTVSAEAAQANAATSFTDQFGEEDGETANVRRLAPGTPLRVSFGGTGPAAEAHYGFSIGSENNPLAPRKLFLVRPGEKPPFVNTSVRLLNGFDYLYDADGGYAGFRWTGQLPPNFGGIGPGAGSR